MERVWARKFQSGQTQKLRKIESSSRRSALNLMKLTLMRSLAAAAVLFSAAAFAQTTGASPSSSSPLPAAPSAASDPTPAVTTNATGSKIGAINVEQAIFGSNEGQRDLDALSKKFEPKSNELKTQNDEIDSLKKQ